VLKLALIGGLAGLAVVGAAEAQTGMMANTPSDPAAMASMSTPQFITAASQSDEFEIQEGKMASRMASSTAVRSFGAQMVHDHTMTTKNLHMAIRQAGMAVPPPPPLRPDQQQMISELRGLSGPAFDKAYLQQQVMAHQQALALMQGYAQNGDVPAIKTAASNTAPIVQNHLTMAQGLMSSVG
jgi:putative membrane protein